MSEPTNKELRQACDRLDAWTYAPDAPMTEERQLDIDKVVDFALSRLDREAEAERRLKVAREHTVRLEGFVRQIFGPKYDAELRALAEIAPAAPEGPKP